MRGEVERFIIGGSNSGLLCKTLPHLIVLAFQIYLSENL